MSAAAHFSTSYAQARERFIAAGRALGLAIDSHPLPGASGVDGEALAQDSLLFGRSAAPSLLVISSGVHGIEGYCGAGCQTGLLHSGAFLERVAATGIAVLFIHAVNPHGFSLGSRVNEDNVDLNRNFLDFSQPLPENPAYGGLHGLLLPETWPPDEGNRAAIAAWIAAHGERKFQEAITAGQHAHQDGLFYGGVQATWSHRTLQQTLARHGAHRSRIAWIDVHTGLGPCAHGERIFADRHDPARLARARRWWGEQVRSLHDPSARSQRFAGMAWNALHAACPGVDYAGLILEFGTRPLLEVIDALRGDHWLRRRPSAAPALGREIKAKIRAAFYVETPAWQEQVFEQTQDAALQAVAGLAS